MVNENSKTDNLKERGQEVEINIVFEWLMVVVINDNVLILYFGY